MMSNANDNDAPTPRELRIFEIDDLIEASDDAQQIEQWEQELEQISLLSDEAYEATLSRGARNG